MTASVLVRLLAFLPAFLLAFLLAFLPAFLFAFLPTFLSCEPATAADVVRCRARGKFDVVYEGGGESGTRLTRKKHQLLPLVKKRGEKEEKTEEGEEAEEEEEEENAVVKKK